MRTESTRGRRWTRRLLAAGLAAAGGSAVAQPPAPPAADYGSRPVAYFTGMNGRQAAVSRADLAEYLINRGGYAKAEFLVNKMIIEHEAAERGVTVTPQEMEAALNETLRTLNNVTKEQFAKVLLPNYQMSFYEYMEDKVRPKLLIEKMCRDKVTVTDADLKIAYEREYGEKRVVRIIIWPGDADGLLRDVQKVWDVIHKDDAKFLEEAKRQAISGLASTAGEIKPVTRHTATQEKHVEQAAFALKTPGEVSEIVRTQAGLMVMKLIRVEPARADVAFEAVKGRYHKDMFEEKLDGEVRKFFGELYAKAKPNVLLKDPPPQWRLDPKDVKQEAIQTLQQTGMVLPPGK